MKKTHGEISQDFLRAMFKTDRRNLERMFELIDRSYDVFGEEVYLDALRRFREFIGSEDVQTFKNDILPIFMGSFILNAAFYHTFNTEDLGEVLSEISHELDYWGKSPDNELKTFEAILMNQEYPEEKKTSFIKKFKQLLK